MDQELLSGVSIGFQTPSITDGLPPMTGSIPNVVSLPYGKCPPLHLKAPSWKHLLRLLARLSSSRLEPSVETHAVTKDSVYRLRTVVQFVKSHPMSQMWHTVLWFTIDHPVPSALPGAYKYTSNDPSILPFSYTLSSLPALLQETGDTKLSKTYTIPTTEQTPWPVLPITFPNLAMYLQAVLQESRRYQDDSTTAIRKFARMVTACYPSTEAGQFPDTEEGKKGMTGLFKKLKPSRGNKKSNGGRGNEDTYELVTPFTPDEWG
ncbi:hypothetical protein DL96DRAFT_942268 [Flagelloscypha sp. PMI_526]|nr:hypothetical protein DL96DRAFT_942268 [Flagelloscypha sp. PMI_526]